MLETLSAADPSNGAIRARLAAVHQTIISALSPTGSDGAAAMESFRKAVAIQEALSAGAPQSVAFRRSLAFTHQEIGLFLDRSGDLAGALERHQTSLAIHKEIAGADPGNAEARYNLATCYGNIGSIQGKRGETASAIRNLSVAFSLAESVLAADPSNAKARHFLAALCADRGNTHRVASQREGVGARRQTEHLRDARSWYRRSESLYLALRAEGKLRPSHLPALEEVRLKLADCEVALNAS
jgi:tetratricopeptide (TPR) repeat protein